MMDKAVTNEAVGQRYLKTPDGAVYGPVDVVTLCSWAADARVVPGCRLSPDGKDWRPAETIPELRLNWVVNLSDGTTYGPLNLLAIWTLMLEGSIQRGMPVQDISGTRQFKVDDTLLPVLVEESRALLSNAGKQATELMGVIHEWRRQDREAVTQRDARVAELQDRLVKAEEEISAHVKLVDASQRYLAEREQVASQAEAASRDQAELRADVIAAKQLLQDAERQVREAAGSLEAARQRQAEMADQMEALRAQVAEGESRQSEWATRIAAAEAETHHVRVDFNTAFEREKAAWADRLSAAEAEAQKVSAGLSAVFDREKADWAIRLSTAEEEMRRVRSDLSAAVEREEAVRQQHAAVERELKEQLEALSRVVVVEREAREKAEADKQAGIEALTTALGEWESRFAKVMDDIRKQEALLRHRDSELETYRRKAEEREAEVVSRFAALRREADASGRRTQELKDLLAQAQRQAAEARQEASAVEQRLCEQLESVQRDLNGVMTAQAAAKPLAAPLPSIDATGKINWLEGASGAGGVPAGGATDMPSLREALKLSTEEKQALRSALDNLRSSHEDFKQDTQGRVDRLQKDVTTTANMLQQALTEVEQREALMRSMRKKAEEREVELLGRIEELETSVGRSVVVEPEVITPGQERRHPPSGEPEATGKGPSILNTVEAQLRSELKKWETLSQTNNGKPNPAKWFRRK